MVNTALLLACCAFFLMPEWALGGMMLASGKDCQPSLTAQDTGKDVEFMLQVNCVKPQKQDVGVRLEYYLPQNVQIFSLSKKMEVEKTGEYTVLRWQSLASEASTYVVKFAVLKPGFYRIYGRVSLDEIPERRLKEIGAVLAEKIPAYSGADEKSALYKKHFLNSSSEIRKLLGKDLGLEPETCYLQISDHSFRIETWDFGSLLKRLRHWFETRGR